MDDDDALPSVTAGPGSVGSRFVSQDDIDSAKARRDEQWKAAYARLGQEPPPRPVEDVYDGRSLAEKLAANKIAKQEEWEEKNRLANQFRALEEDEVLFLDTIRAEEEKKELKRKRDDAEEVKDFMEAVAARNALPDKPPTSTSPTTTKPKTINPPIVSKKPAKAKNALKGVVVKKKSSKPAGNGTATATATADFTNRKAVPKDGKEAAHDSQDERQSERNDESKKQRLSAPSSSD
ncbi:hypothetical protein ACEPAF_3733 [Sanghuangporus sanghuang]